MVEHWKEGINKMEVHDKTYLMPLAQKTGKCSKMDTSVSVKTNPHLKHWLGTPKPVISQRNIELQRMREIERIKAENTVEKRTIQILDTTKTTVKQTVKHTLEKPIKKQIKNFKKFFEPVEV